MNVTGLSNVVTSLKLAQETDSNFSFATSFSFFFFFANLMLTHYYLYYLYKPPPEHTLNSVNWPLPHVFNFTDWLIWPFRVPDLKYFHAFCQKFFPLQD